MAGSGIAERNRIAVCIRPHLSIESDANKQQRMESNKCEFNVNECTSVLV